MIQNEMPSYPYKAFCQELADRTVCLICDEELEDYENYLIHIKRNPHHYHAIERKLRYTLGRRKNKDGTLVARPIEKQLLDDNIKNDKTKWRLKRGIIATSQLNKEIEHAIKDDDIVVVEVVGVPASGKSVSALALAVSIATKWAKRLVKDGEIEPFESEEKCMEYVYSKIHIGFNHAETSALTRIANKGDVIIQDEDPAALGGGAVASKVQIENILKIMRQRCVSYVFVSPLTVPYLHTVNFRLETYAKEYKTRTNKLVLYDRRDDALGWIYIKILPKDNPLMIDYLERKTANIEKIKDSGGKFSAGYDDEEMLEDIETLYDYIKSKYRPEQLQKMTLGQMKFLSKIVINGVIEYQDGVAWEVFYRIQEDNILSGIDEPVVVKKLGQGYEWIHYRTETDIAVLNDVYEIAKTLGLDDAQARGNEAFKLHIIDGQAQKVAVRQINTMFDESRTPAMYFRKKREKVSAGYFQQFQLGKMGTAAELAVQKWFYPEYEYSAENGTPDLIGDNHIVEIKIRDEKRNPEELIARDEYIRDYIQRKHPIDLVLVTYGVEGLGSCKVYFYTIAYGDT